MKTIVFTSIVFFIAIQTFAMDFYEKVPNHKLKHLQEDSLKQPGIAVYPELLGKGFYSFNVDFPITFNHRFSVGVTQLDYSFAEYENYSVGPNGAPTLGVMYYYLAGKNKSFFELGAGFSLYHRLSLDYADDSPLSLHGVVGYRYQKKDGLIFRIGFTPFKRVNNWFLPLIGISLGYSW